MAHLPQESSDALLRGYRFNSLDAWKCCDVQKVVRKTRRVLPLWFPWSLQIGNSIPVLIRLVWRRPLCNGTQQSHLGMWYHSSPLRTCKLLAPNPPSNQMRLTQESDLLNISTVPSFPWSASHPRAGCYHHWLVLSWRTLLRRGSQAHRVQCSSLRSHRGTLLRSKAHSVHPLRKKQPSCPRCRFSFCRGWTVRSTLKSQNPSVFVALTPAGGSGIHASF